MHFPIRHRRAARGFTLIELMIAVVIVGILAAVAWPSYRSYVQRGELAEAKTAMLDIAQTQERYYTNNGSYLAYAEAPAAAPSGWTNYTGSSASNFKYKIKVEAGTIDGSVTTITDAYKITATPSNASAPCGTLQLDSTGAKSPATAASIGACW
ncbi:type IV pilin protein [Noviherbaspirillum pedocola]|uniref:Type IV pilin protein n=1 Tax=Noviherbaspirillum pedocola TaxID=2801341 RepID=A0A934SZW7_9BURK|nr:type IV pilin protein [Noviherbaspirillum pedocola]MBK4738081.1 type IV pilin protein [Noviherbaspirillum pedocola]